MTTLKQKRIDLVREKLMQYTITHGRSYDIAKVIIDALEEIEIPEASKELVFGKQQGGHDGKGDS